MTSSALQFTAPSHSPEVASALRGVEGSSGLPKNLSPPVKRPIGLPANTQPDVSGSGRLPADLSPRVKRCRLLPESTPPNGSTLSATPANLSTGVSNRSGLPEKMPSSVDHPARSQLAAPPRVGGFFLLHANAPNVAKRAVAGESRTGVIVTGVIRGVLPVKRKLWGRVEQKNSAARTSVSLPTL